MADESLSFWPDSLSPEQHRAQIKTHDKYAVYQNERRAHALGRQRKARTDRVNNLRLLLEPGVSREETDCDGASIATDSDARGGVELAASMAIDRTSTSRCRADCEDDGLIQKQAHTADNMRLFYTRQLMQPEWLTDVPDDLAQSWCVMPRPEGTRCLVIASRGWTVSRLRNGSIKHRFRSSLPGGGPSHGDGGAGQSVLDCIFQEGVATYFVLDVMCWRGHALYDCAMDFRAFWLRTRLAEDGAFRPMGGQQYPFAPLPLHPCSVCGLRAAYTASLAGGGVMDGLYLRHAEGRYELGRSPLALLWKDAGCSRYLLDTDAEGQQQLQQEVVLTYRMDGTVATDDDPPVVLGLLPDNFRAGSAHKLEPGKLIRFAIGPGGIQFAPDGVPAGADLRLLRLLNSRRARADAFSRILFQRHVRDGRHVTLQHLVHAAAAAPAPSMAAAMY